MSSKIEGKVIHSVKCGICRNEIFDRAELHQAGLNLGVVCCNCYKQFSTKDLEMMANMFIAYGGHFGMVKDTKFSLVKTLENILKKSLREKDVFDSEQINIKLIHKALLHGITPEQYVRNLSLLIDE
ncbi:MAG: hypothetical protein ACFFE4_05715 [Candidatus Thorarchaeota archaeon]